MEPLRAEFVHHPRDLFRVWDLRIRKRLPRWLGRVDTALAVHFVQPLRAVVVGAERFVVDRPGRRDSVGVLDRAEIFLAEAIHHASPELGVPAHTVVGVGPEFMATGVYPTLGRAIAEVLPGQPPDPSSEVPAG